MFAGFKLDMDRNSVMEYIFSDFGRYQELGRRHLREQKEQIREDLEKFIYNEAGGQTIDGTLMQDEWFPQVKADVFLSHSHQDLILAEGLAGWLHETFGLSCFIDSNVWGYADDLLEMLNARYSDKRPDGHGGYLYDHQKCNAASKHVNVMLDIALHKMIDRTEAVFLLCTDNSVRRYGDCDHDNTYSPWIYSEIVCSEIVRKKQLKEYRPQNWRNIYWSEGKKGYMNFTRVDSAADSLRIAYEVSTEHLASLKAEKLRAWEQEHRHRNFKYPLDWLYMHSLDVKMDKLRAAYENPENYRTLFGGEE